MIINLSPVVTVHEGTYRLTVGCDGGSPSPFDTHDTFTVLFFLYSFLVYNVLVYFFIFLSFSVLCFYFPSPFQACFPSFTFP